MNLLRDLVIGGLNMTNKSLGVNPWINIWTKPRDTIKKIVSFNPKYRFLILSFLYGLPMLLHSAQNLNLGESYTAVGIVIVAIVLATFLGMLGITIASALLHWTGKWIGGKADYHKVRAAVSWSNVPNIISIIVWILMIFAFKNQVFLENFDQMHTAGKALGFLRVGAVIEAIAAIWSFIILVKGLGQVQGFSAWKGILNVLIPFFMVGIVIWLISWAISIATGMPFAM